MQTKTVNHLSSAAALILIAFISVTAFLAADAEGASYKWTDASGNEHFTNDPVEAAQNNATQVGSSWSPSTVEEEPSEAEAESKPTEPEEVEEQKAKDSDEKEEPEMNNGVVLEGEFQFFTSLRGNTVLVAELKNILDIPVSNVSIDVIIFLKSRKRSDTISIPLANGDTPGTIAPGKTGKIEQEINIQEDEIAGHRYQIHYNYETVVEAPKEGEELPPGVKHTIIPGKPRSAEKSAELMSAGSE